MELENTEQGVKVFGGREAHVSIPQPFKDILDVPPEERHLPDGMTIYDLLQMPVMSEANMRRIAFSLVKPSHIPVLDDVDSQEQRPSHGNNIMHLIKVCSAMYM